ncbi:MAG: hypothetical protein ACRD15_22220 [Vicinamibacterales bacterium]
MTLWNDVRLAVRTWVIVLTGREFYIAHTQAPGWQAYALVVRASEPLIMVPAIREAIWRIDRIRR